METIQEYQYSPLLEPDAFRIIIVHPAALISEPLSCDLIHSTLFHYNESMIDHYISLSYVWGDANDKRTIIVDEKRLAITANLDSALRHLRNPNHDIAIWADGICIKQSDDQERNGQVGLMGLIYQVARHAIIFLGETSSETDGIFEPLDLSTPASTDQRRGGFLSNVRDSSGNEATHIRNEEDIESKIEKLIHHLPNIPWFTRINFTNLILNNASQNQALARSPGYKLLYDMQKIRKDFILSESTEPQAICDYLLRILHSRRGHGVLDPRDMLYAHMGLFKHEVGIAEVERLLEIDYRKSIADVYTDLALYLLNRKCDFGFLAHVEVMELEARRPELPSWVPDWTSFHVSSEAQYYLKRGLGQVKDMSSIHLKLGQPAVLGCIGTNLDVIKIIKDSAPPIDDVLALCQKIKDLSPLYLSRFSNSHISWRELFEDVSLMEMDLKKAFCILYNYLCSWIGVDYLPHSEADFGHRSSAFTRRMTRICNARNFRNLPPIEACTDWWHRKTNFAHDNPESLMLPQLLVALTDWSGAFFADKKVAVLQNNKLALVSSQAQVGDIICHLNNDLGMYFVLRLINSERTSAHLNSTLVDFFTTNQDTVRNRYVKYTHNGCLISIAKFPIPDPRAYLCCISQSSVFEQAGNYLGFVVTVAIA
ncbi:hypothetical protein NHQ30_010888 [Ciborinia camelliae]|nr:hypothetical protein NHQ30_010888 [Ciborinia camelliae]